MAVHAAYPLRKDRGCLGRIATTGFTLTLTRPGDRTVRRLTATLSKAARLSDDEVGAILACRQAGVFSTSSAPSHAGRWNERADVLP